MNFADAAEEVLRKNSRKALHSSEIAERAIALGLISPRSNTPGTYVAAAMRKDNRRRQQRGEAVRFALAGDGRFELVSNR
jgi:HB1, ASXL, restriction endonuclease HTH domain